jgi:hypothetical protein
LATSRPHPLAALLLFGQPDMAQDREREMDTFVTDLRFTELPTGGIGAKGRKQIELDLGG